MEHLSHKCHCACAWCTSHPLVVQLMPLCVQQHGSAPMEVVPTATVMMMVCWKQQFFCNSVTVCEFVSPGQDGNNSKNIYPAWACWARNGSQNCVDEGTLLACTISCPRQCFFRHPPCQHPLVYGTCTSWVAALQPAPACELPRSCASCFFSITCIPQTGIPCRSSQKALCTLPCTTRMEPCSWLPSALCTSPVPMAWAGHQNTR